MSGSYNRVNPRGGFTDINATIDALSQDQLIRTLAEPNLTALSGETASFLVGGEFPIPVAQQNNAISVEFKQYGISLSFVPTVLGGDRIVLHVRPEVSQITEPGCSAVVRRQRQHSNPGHHRPACRHDGRAGVRARAFAIAGLLQDSQKLTGLGLPFLGDVPILGALFRSDSFQQSQTELVIVVTPYVVRPVSDPAMIALPDDGYKVPNDLERILLLRQKGLGSVATPVRVPGNAGFVLP